MINQPLPNYLGWLLYSMPLWVHKLGLAAFFVSEIIVPFGFVFFSGSTRVICALATIVLQVHIQAAGNFGFFNLLSALLCLPCLDGASVFLSDFAWSDVAAAPVTHLFLGGVLAPLSLFFLLVSLRLHVCKLMSSQHSCTVISVVPRSLSRPSAAVASVLFLTWSTRSSTAG